MELLKSVNCRKSTGEDEVQVNLQCCHQDFYWEDGGCRGLGGAPENSWTTLSTLAINGINDTPIGWLQNLWNCWSNTVNGTTMGKRRHSDLKNYCDLYYTSEKKSRWRALSFCQIQRSEAVAPPRSFIRGEKHSWRKLKCHWTDFLKNLPLPSQAADLKKELLILQCHKQFENLSDVHQYS